MLAEALPVSHGAHFSGDVSKASALQDMMRTVSILKIIYLNIIFCFHYKLMGVSCQSLVFVNRGHFDVTINKDRSLNFFLLQLVTSGVSSYQHTSVTLEFFETVVRYEKFFTVEPQHIPCVLVSKHFTYPPFLLFSHICQLMSRYSIFLSLIFSTARGSQKLFSETLECTDTNPSSIKKNFCLISHLKQVLKGLFVC